MLIYALSIKNFAGGWKEVKRFETYHEAADLRDNLRLLGLRLDDIQIQRVG